MPPSLVKWRDVHRHRRCHLRHRRQPGPVAFTAATTLGVAASSNISEPALPSLPVSLTLVLSTLTCGERHFTEQFGISSTSAAVNATGNVTFLAAKRDHRQRAITSSAGTVSLTAIGSPTTATRRSLVMVASPSPPPTTMPRPPQTSFPSPPRSQPPPDR